MSGLFLLLTISALVACSMPLKTAKSSTVESASSPALPNQYYWYTESQIQLRKGNLDNAVQFIHKAIEEDPESSFLKIELARLYLQQNNPSAALELMKAVLDKNPEDIESLILFGRIKQSQNESKSAAEAYETVLSLDPSRRNIYLFLGNLYMKGNAPDQAANVYSRLVERFPDSYIGHFFLGKIYSEQKRWDEAEWHFKRTLELKPELEEPRYELVQIYRQTRTGTHFITVNHGDSLSSLIQTHFGKYTPNLEAIVLEMNPDLKDSDAIYAGQKLVFPIATRDEHPDAINGQNEKIIQIYQSILARNDQNIRAAMELGLFYHQIGRINEADALFVDLGRRSLSEKPILRTVVKLFLDQKEYANAIIVVSGMLNGAPESSDLHYIAGVANNGAENPVQALTHFLQVQPDSSFFKNAAINAAIIYHEQGEIHSAIDLLAAAMEKAPESAEIPLYLGSFYEELENFESAERVLLQGLEIDPENAKILFRLGVVYDKWGKKAESIDAMKKVINLEPKNANALNYLGYTYADMGRNLDEAEQYIIQALELMPNDGYITDSLGWVYFKKGEFEKAVKYLEMAVELVPDDPIILEHLGDAYLKLNDREKALKFYERSKHSREERDEKLEKKIMDLKQ